MLNRFSVENFLSFRERIEFSMMAGKSTRLMHHIQAPKNTTDFKRLKSAVIYGANASGKSNLIRAIQFMQKLVLVGTKSENRIPLQKFKLEQNENRNSRFEVEFFINGRNYAYGFVLDEKAIYEEWLVSTSRRSENVVFSRRYDGSGNLTFDHPGIKLVDSKEATMFDTIAEFCPENQLFATEYKNGRKRIHSHIDKKILVALEDLIEWFGKKLTIVFPNTINYQSSSYSAVEVASYNTAVSKIINCYDTGILKIRPQEIARSVVQKTIPESALQQMEENMKDDAEYLLINPDVGDRVIIKRQDGDFKYYKMYAEHENPTAGTTMLEFVEESDGTKRLFDLIPAYMSVLTEKDSVLIIDEIDRSLHTQIASSLLSSFHEVTASSGGQLIITTHETNLLDQNLVRKDEIWFVSKTKGVSSVYSLEEYLPRYDKDIRSAYLKGRFGGIPLIYQNPSDICRKVASDNVARTN